MLSLQYYFELFQNLLENPQRLFGLILTPTRELAFQIGEQFEALGKSIGVKCAVLVGKKFVSNFHFKTMKFWVLGAYLCFYI